MGKIVVIKSEYEKTLKLISIKALSDKRLTPSEKGVLYMILYTTNLKKWTTKEMSNQLEISEPTLIKYLKKYKQLGYIKNNEISDYNKPMK